MLSQEVGDRGLKGGEDLRVDDIENRGWGIHHRAGHHRGQHFIREKGFPEKKFF